MVGVILGMGGVILGMAGVILGMVAKITQKLTNRTLFWCQTAAQRDPQFGQNLKKAIPGACQKQRQNKHDLLINIGLPSDLEKVSFHCKGVQNLQIQGFRNNPQNRSQYPPILDRCGTQNDTKCVLE